MKNEAAVALGRLGGKARALKLGVEGCREAARKAGSAPKKPRAGKEQAQAETPTLAQNTP